ncbi:MAG: ArsO family NAD(P)H-dependent flavin-containing monooxygenase [Pseudorhizobium sp.]
MVHVHDVVVVGAGQAGLATAYYLRRAGVDFILLDASQGPGGAWQQGWHSLTLFSPASYSSLPGWMMPSSSPTRYPGRDDVVDYLARYEKRYAFRVLRPVRVSDVQEAPGGLDVVTDGKIYRARVVVSATGTFSEPYVPRYPGQDSFEGAQLHSAQYRSGAPFVGKSVIVVGGGNSGAQIAAELSEVAKTTWVTPKPPVFLPDDVDGRVLFERASAKVLGDDSGPVGSLGDIVTVPPVKKARDEGRLSSIRPFAAIDKASVVWEDGSSTPADAIIWCTGFKPALRHLQGLGLLEEDGRVLNEKARSLKQPRLWLAGYGNWTGAASATLLGAGRTARDVVPEIVDFLKADAC